MLKPIVLAHRIAARLGEGWLVEARAIGAQVVGPNSARIEIEDTSLDTLQVSCKPTSPMDKDFSFTAIRTWPPERVVAQLTTDYLPAYLRTLEDRLDERSDAKKWAAREREALEEIGGTLSIKPHIRIEGQQDEPNTVRAYFDLGSSGDVTVEVLHRGNISVRMSVTDTDVLSVLIPVMATYNNDSNRRAQPVAA